MEKKLCIRSHSSSPITALIYQPVRREIVAGHEDGSLKSWELDSGKLVNVANHHKGWITDLLFWSEGKVLFSSSLDYTVVQWSSSGTPFKTIELGSPIYSLLWNPRKDGLFCGRHGFISMLSPSGKNSSNGLPLLSRQEIRVDGHTGVVKCLASAESKVYSAGYDNKLVVYDVSTMPGNREPPLKAVCTHHNAHNAGISCLIVAKDTDSSTWIATGSFDNTCKLWMGDGKQMFQLQCSGPVTGLCYVPQTGVLWVSARSLNYYEPKSGECITDVIPILNDKTTYDKNRFIQLIKFFPEVNEVFGSTNLKEVIRWSYTPSCSVCVHSVQSTQAHIETITYTSKRPILMFTGSYDGLVTKWERQQLNPFMYSTEQISYKDKLSTHLTSEDAEWNIVESAFGSGFTPTEDGLSMAEVKEAKQKLKERARKKLLGVDYRGFVCSLFVERLDYLVCSCLDGRIFVWGYDKSTVSVLRDLQKKSRDGGNGKRMQTTATDTEDPVINRVAGFICLQILNGHTGCSSGLELVEQNSNSYLVSAGWDGAICVWELVTGKLLAKIQHKSASSDIITCISYNPIIDCIAYSMSDCVVYIRKFSTRQAQMSLVGTLQGHSEEVTQVRWNNFIEKWVTASDDGTIRIWRCEGGEDCELIVSAGDPVSLITIDKTYGLILAAVHNVIKVYNSDLEQLQVCRGHEDSVRAITHIPENDQYLSSGWDKTLRIWPAYHPRSQTNTS